MADPAEAGSHPAIDCTPEVFETVRAAVMEGFLRLPHGGLEVGGVLFGSRGAGSMYVTACRPIPCCYAHGPTFTLSDREHADLAKLLQAPSTEPDLRGLLPLGWYHSHTRSGLELSEHDIEVHNRWFPEVWQAALLLHPTQSHRLTAAIFLRDTLGSLLKAREFTFEPRAGAPATTPVVRAATSEPGKTVAAPPEAREAPTTFAAQEAPQSDAGLQLPSFARVPRRAARPGARWWLLFAAAWLVAAASLAFAFRDYWYPQPPALQISLQEAGGQLFLQWNRDVPAIREAEAGMLEIQDGERRRFLELSSQALRGGTNVVIGRQSGRVSVRLQVSLPRRRVAEGRAVYEGEPVPPDPAGAMSGRQELEAEIERLKTELSNQNQRNRELEADLARVRKQPPARP